MFLGGFFYMDKIEFKDLKLGSNISFNNKARIIDLKNGEVVKIFNMAIFGKLKLCGYDLEGKILDAKKLESVPEIIVPNKAVYENGSFVGYTMNKAKGENFNDVDEKYTLYERSDLRRYVTEFSQLEDIIKRGNKEGIVFPDFATCDNIYLTNKGKFSLIDYDGLQVGNHEAICISTSLGDEHQYVNKKYMADDKLYTSQLDIKSLIVLFFLSAFNVNLGKIGTRAFDGPITLDYVFNQIGLDDDAIKHKVWKLFQDNIDNEFLGDDIWNLVNKYKMIAKRGSEVSPYLPNDVYVKKLVRK